MRLHQTENYESFLCNKDKNMNVFCLILLKTKEILLLLNMNLLIYEMSFGIWLSKKNTCTHKCIQKMSNV